MTFALLNVALIGALFVGMFALQAAGRRLAELHDVREPKRDHGTTAAETAVLALLGLFLAFAFSGAASRFEMRRDQIVEEANAVGTAWLRIDLLPADRQPQIRELFRRYVDARLERYGAVSDFKTSDAATARAAAFQGEIWAAALAAAAPSETSVRMLIVPALNDMFDIATTREAAMHKHSPPAVYAMMAILALVGALFAGYGMAGKARSWAHSLGFSAVMAMTIYVIVDLEFPRAGLIRIDSADAVLADVRASMN